MALEQRLITLTQIGTDAGPDFSVQYSTDCVNYVQSPDCENVFLPSAGSSVVCTVDSNTTCIKLISLSEKCGNEVVKDLTPTTSTTSTTLAPTTTTTLSPTTSTTLAPTTTTTLAPTTTTTLSPTTSTTTVAPTTTTTTFACPSCEEYEIANNSQVPGDTLTFEYVDCDTQVITQGTVPYDSLGVVCSCTTPVRVSGPTSIVITNLGFCNGTTTTLSPTTSTTTTTLSPTGCYEWDINCPSGNPTGCNVNYTDCNGDAQSINVPDDTAGVICARPTPSSTSATITLVGTCTLTTTTTIAPTTSTTTLPPVTQIYSDTQPGGGNLNPCECDALTVYNYQVLGSSVNITQDMTGDTIYENYDTNTLFAGDDKWYCISSTNGTLPTINIQINNSGIVTNWIDCSTLTSTTTLAPTTTTTTIALGCYEYTLECALGNPAGCTIDYTDCTGTSQQVSIPEDSLTVVCARPTPSFTVGSGTVTFEGNCPVTTTTTVSPTTTTTLGQTTTTTNCPATIYTHGAVRGTCSDYCTTNYLIQTQTCADNDYASLTIGDTIYGYTTAGWVAYSNVSTDTNTGPFKIAEINSSGVVINIEVCSGNACVPL